MYAPRPANAIAWRYSLEDTEPAQDRPSPTRIDLRFASARPGSITTPTTFVGREAEMAMLRRHVDQARHGIGGVVLIRGTAGVGKTRIARELLDEAMRSGMVTFEGNCYDREDPMPFAPFVEILEAALERTSSREDFRALLGAEAAKSRDCCRNFGVCLAIFPHRWSLRQRGRSGCCSTRLAMFSRGWRRIDRFFYYWKICIGRTPAASPCSAILRAWVREFPS